MANGFGIEDELARLRAELGLPPVEEEGGLWDTIFQPVKGIIGATGNVGGQLAGLLNPEAYQAAAEQLRTDLKVDETSTLFEKGEALPGLGDVAAHMLPEEITQGTVGQVTGPVARMIANALGDPTTYTPYVLGKLGQVALKGIPAYRAARGVQAGFVGPLSPAEATANAAKIQKAIATGSKVQQAGAWMGQHAMPIDRAMMVGGLAYAPELVESVGTSAAESWRLLKEQQYGEAVKVGASGALLGGLAALIGKGVFDTRRADQMLDASVRKENPAAADAKVAVDEGRLAVETDPDILEAAGLPIPTMEERIGQLPIEQALEAPPGPPRLGEVRGRRPPQVTEPAVVEPTAPAPPSPEAQAPLTAPEAPLVDTIKEAAPSEGPPPEAPPPAEAPARAEGMTDQQVLQRIEELDLQRERLLSEPVPPAARVHVRQAVAAIDQELLALREARVEAPPKATVPSRIEEPTKFEEGKPAEPPGPVMEKPPGIVPKARRVEGEPRGATREPIGHLEVEDMAALEKGLDPKERAKLDEDLQKLAEDSGEPAGVKKGIEKAIDELTIRHGASEERLALALRTMQDELSRLRNIGRLRKAIVESPDLKVRLREVSEAYDYVDENRSRWTELRKKGDKEALTKEETTEVSDYKARLDVISQSPLLVEIIEVSGGKGVDPDEAVEFVQAAVKALEKGDVEAIQTRLADVVNDRMAALGAMPEVDPRIIRSMGGISRKLTGEDVSPNRQDANMKAIEEMWQGINRGRKYGLEGEELTIPQVFERFLEEGTEAEATTKLSSFMEKIIRQVGKSRERDIIRAGTTVVETPIAKVIDDADDLDLRYRGEKVSREDLKQYAEIRKEKGLTAPEIAERMGKTEEELVGLNTLYNTMKSRTRRKVPREEPVKVTEEGAPVEARGEESITLAEKTEDTYSLIEKQSGKTIDEFIDDAPKEDFLYGKEKRKVSREELKKYVEGKRDGLSGKALGEFMWGKDSANKRTHLEYVHDEVFGLREKHQKLLADMNTAADSFYNNFLKGKKISELDIDDDFTNALARLRAAVGAATDAQLLGKGKRGPTSPTWGVLRQWAGIPPEAHPGKGTVLAAVEARLKAQLPGEAQAKLKRAELPELREELEARTGAQKTANRLGLLAGSDVVEQARGKRLPKAQRGLPSLAKPKKVNTTGTLADRYPPGTYSGYEAPGNGRVYYTAGEKAEGENIVILGTRGEGSLAQFLSEARRRGTKTVEIPNELFQGLTPELTALRQAGVLKRHAPTKTSRMYPVEPGPPRTAAQLTDAAAIGEATRGWFSYLRNRVEENSWLVESLNKVAAQTLGRGRGYVDLLQRMAHDVVTGKNLFRRDVSHPHTALRELYSTLYLKGGTKVFDDFAGVKSALADVQRQFGISPKVEPLYLTNGANNSVFAIGPDRNGNPLVMKINANAPKQLFLEDRVAAAKSFMLPTLRAGTTKEGWNYRIERRGVPMTIERPGIMIPTDLPEAVGIRYRNHQAAIRKLEDAGVVKVLDDKPEQWVVVDGKPYLADRGAIAPAKGKFSDWMAQQEALDRHSDELTPRQRDARDTQYEKAIGDPINGAVNLDGIYGRGFQKRLGDATTEMSSTFDEILAEMSVMAKRVEGAEGVGAVFGGVTASPYLRGLYADGKVYANPMEVLYRHLDDPRAAAEEMVGTMVHEMLHEAIILHTDNYFSLVDQLRFVSDIEGKFDAWTDKMETQFKKRTTALDELMPEYREAAYNAGSFGRESWRGEARLRADAVHTPEGSLARAPDQRLEGAADLEARGGAGVQRGEVVSPRLRGETGPLGEAPADRGAYARETAEGPEGLARGEEEGRRVATAETGRGEGGPETVEEAHRILVELMDDPKTPITTTMSRSVEMAFQLAHRIGRTPAGKDALKELATGKPSRSEVLSRYNLDQVEGVSDTAKAAITLWSRITAGIPELSRQFKADTVRTWDELDVGVKKLLDVKSKRDLWAMLGKGRKGLTDTEVVLAKILGADLIREVEYRASGLAEEQLMLAEGRGSLSKVADAEKAMQIASRNFAEGMPRIINPLTETGRALAAARKAARAQSPEAAMLQDMRASLYERLRTKYPEEADAQRVTDELMTLWAKVRSGAVDPETGRIFGPQDWAEAYRNAYKFSRFDQFLEAYKAFLLGWKSRVANISSNALVQGVRELERTVAIGLEKVQAKIQGRQAERFWGEVKLNGAIMKHWGATALPEWWTAFKDGLAMRPEDMTLDPRRTGSLSEDIGFQVGAIKGTVGEFVRFMFKGMTAEDALFKRASQLQYYYKTVYRNLRQKKAGWEMRPGEDIYAATKRHVEDIEEQWLKKMKGDKPDPTLLKKYAEIHDEGFRIAREETFQKELPEFMKAFQNALRKPGGKPFQMIFPFVRTPYNIALETLRRTPAGFYEVASKWNKVSAPERMDLLARPLVGTTVGLWLINEAMQGNITGGGPLDPIDEANLRETGWRAYSLRVGNQYLGYQRLEPMSSIVGMAADIAEGRKRGDFATVERATTRLFSLVTENLTNKTFLSGLEGLSTAMADPQRSAGRWIKQMQTSIIPNTIGPIPFGHLAQAVDPIYRQSEPMSWDAFGTKVPFLSKTLAPQYTPTGELRERPGTGIERLVSPIVRTQARTDPTAVAASLMDRIGSPPTPPKKFTFVKGVKVYYTPEQREMLARAQSQATKIIGTRLVKDPGFMSLPDNEDVAPLGVKTKKQVIKSLFDKYRRSVVVRFQADLYRKAQQHKGGEWRP